MVTLYVHLDLGLMSWVSGSRRDRDFELGIDYFFDMSWEGERDCMNWMCR